MARATDIGPNGNNESWHDTRSPLSTPSSFYSHGSPDKAKSPSTPLSTPPSEEAGILDPGVVSEHEREEIEVLFSYNSYWEMLTIDDLQKRHWLRKRKTGDDVELPVAKKAKVGHHPSLPFS